METIKHKLQSKTFRTVLYVIGSLIVALVIFQAGIFVGFHEAQFSGHLGDNYRRTFGERSFGMISGVMRDSNYPVSNGAVGKIIKITLPTLVIIGPDNIEKVILLQDDTLIREFRNTIKPTDLKLNDEVVVIGAPNTASEIEAKLVRLIPGAMDTQNYLPASTTKQ